MRLAPRFVVLSLALGLVACTGGGTSEPEPDAGPRVYPDEIGGDRPARVYRPFEYDDSAPAPLLILLHGYGASGNTQAIYLGLEQQMDRLGWLLVVPNGTREQLPDGEGRMANLFWNASDTCCNFFDSEVDDVAYIRGLIDEMKRTHNVDAGRVYLFGHSNGGFMAHRVACEAASEITAIASLAGTSWVDAEDCTPSEPVAVLQIHGVDDEVIAYEGGAAAEDTLGPYPSAPAIAARWAAFNGCEDDGATDGEDLDLEPTIDGAETTVLDYRAGCPDTGAVSLWSIEEGRHLPTLFPGWALPMGALDWMGGIRKD